MKILDNIKQAVGNYYLNKAIDNNQRNRKLINYSDVRSVGIIFGLMDIESYYIVHEEALRLQEQQIKVKALGYVRNDNLTRSLMPLLAFDFFYDNSLNWYRKPKALSIDEFVETEFDILIDLNLNGQLPLKFISASSIARIKVGKYEKANENMYDIMIMYEEDSGLKEFINNITHYLIQLKPAENV